MARCADAPTGRQSVFGAVSGGLSLGAVSGIARLVYRPGATGFGDVKSFAMLGAWFGALPALLRILVVASTTASLLGVALALVQRRTLVMTRPLGPFLTLGAVLWLFFSDHLPRMFIVPPFQVRARL